MNAWLPRPFIPAETSLKPLAEYSSDLQDRQAKIFTICIRKKMRIKQTLPLLGSFVALSHLSQSYFGQLQLGPIPFRIATLRPSCCSHLLRPNKKKRMNWPRATWATNFWPTFQANWLFWRSVANGHLGPLPQTPSLQTPHPFLSPPDSPDSPKLRPFISLAHSIFALFRLSRGSSHRIVATGRGHGPLQLCVWAP